MAEAKPTQRDLFPQADPFVTAYEGGESIPKIAARLGMPCSTVQLRLKKAGAKMRTNRKDDIKPGSEFGQLTAKEPRGENWLCVCSCSREELANSTALRKGRHVRCAECRKGPAEAPAVMACSACGLEKPFTGEHFDADHNCRFGLRPRCKDCHRADLREDCLRIRRNLRLEVLTHYSGGVSPFCACCGETEFERLALDHLEGSSRQDYAEHGNTFFYHLRRTGYQLKARVACHNCNAASFAFGYCCVHQPRPADADDYYDRRKTKPRVILPEPTPELVAEAHGRRQACYICSRTFPHSSRFFPSHKQMTAGLLNRCKECDRKDHYRQAKARRERDKAKVLRHYCGETPHCSLCGIAEPAFLTVDHVHGGGLRHRKEEKINNLWRWLIRHRFPEGEFRILCMSCNMSLGFYRELDKS